MNRMLSSAELNQIDNVLAFPPTKLTLSKKAKLQHFAEIVRSGSSRQVGMLEWFSRRDSNYRIFHGLEYMDEKKMALLDVRYSAFADAIADPVFQAAGIGSNLLTAKRFFELSRDELHSFSCDCGGAISNEQMANRIDRLADAA
jgi:hypothetical protein